MRLHRKDIDARKRVFGGSLLEDLLRMSTWNWELPTKGVKSQVRARKAIQYRLRRAIRRAPVLDRDYTVRDVWAIVEGM